MAVCDMSKFPNMKYFQQHEMPEYGPVDFQYDYTRLLVIRAEATIGPANVLVSLNTIMEEFEDGGQPGIPRTIKEWDDILMDHLGAVPTTRVPTPMPGSEAPFDFTLWNKSRVIIMLLGQFWRFSAKMAAVTTKHQYGSQYFDLRRHFLNEAGEFCSIPEADWEQKFIGTKCTCVSFFSQEPCLPVFNARHGFSFNIDLMMEKTLPGGVTVPTTLPITIDPDIENKGGNPGP
jgi:hypothetical protein